MLVITATSAGSFRNVPSDLVGLDHHPLTLAHSGIGAVGIDDAAIDDRRVQPTGFQQRRHQRRGRGLAMRTADRDRIAERISSASISARRTTGSSFSRAATSSGLLFLDRGRDDHHFGVAEVLRLVADKDFDALIAQALHVGAVGLIRSLHAMAEIMAAPRQCRSCRCHRCR